VYLVADALSRLESASGEFFLVEDGHGDWYGITKEALERAAAEGKGGVVVGSVLPRLPLIHVHPDHALDVALRRLGRVPFLPVVHRADFRRLEGVASLQDILKAYQEAHLPAAGERGPGV
jgi:CBS domain-containing protein